MCWSYTRISLINLEQWLFADVKVSYELALNGGDRQQWIAKAGQANECTVDMINSSHRQKFRSLAIDPLG